VSITVVLPARNEEMTISRTLESLINQSIVPKEIIVVLDRCTDKTESVIDEMIKSHIIITKIVKDSTKYEKSFMKGFRVAETVNLGLGSLNSFSDFIMIANGDSVYSKNYFEEALKTFESDQMCGLVGYSHYATISGSGYVVRSKILKQMEYRLKECAAEDTYLQFKVLNLGYSIKSLTNVNVKLLRDRGEGTFSSRIKYMFAKGYASYTLGYSFGYEILRTGYWILKGKLSSVGIIFGFIYGVMTKAKKLDIANTDVPKKWQKERLRSVFS